MSGRMVIYRTADGFEIEGWCPFDPGYGEIVRPIRPKLTTHLFLGTGEVCEYVRVRERRYRYAGKKNGLGMRIYEEELE